MILITWTRDALAAAFAQCYPQAEPDAFDVFWTVAAWNVDPRHLVVWNRLAWTAGTWERLFRASCPDLPWDPLALQMALRASAPAIPGQEWNYENAMQALEDRLK